MNRRQRECSDDQLLELLRRDSEATSEDPVVLHVSSCRRCQCRMGELTATHEEWNHLREALDNTESVRDKFCPFQFRSNAEIEIASIKQLLSPPSHPEMLGRLDRYEIERPIGVGGMGIVFKGYDSELSRPVAIKVLSPYLQHVGLARQRFAREARAVATVAHQHVVAIYDVAANNQFPYLVMHYVAGESLQSRIERQGALKLEEVLRIGFQIASGLAAAHEQGLTHRDIKPSNVLLEGANTDRALLSDFGLARAADDVEVTRAGAFVGTPQYMSPEQASGKAVDHLSDLFSFGSVLFTMCTGKPPFPVNAPLVVMNQIIESRVPTVTSCNPEIPDWMSGIIQKLHAKRPEDRFDSAAQVCEMLKSCLSHVQQPNQVALPPSLTKMTTASSSGNSLLKSSWLALVAGAIILSLAFMIPGQIGRIFYLGTSGSNTNENVSPNEILSGRISSPPVTEQLGFGFSRKGDLILFEGETLDAANRRHDSLLNNFGKKKFKIPEELAVDVDASTFRALSETYAKDQNRVYFRREICNRSLFVRLPGADVETFEIVTRSLAKDKNSTWVYGRPNANVHTPSLRVIREDKVWRDRSKVWFGSHFVDGASPSTFRHLSSEYYLDENRAYWASQPIENADVTTFRTLESNLPYARDRNKVWYKNKIVEDVDASSFVVLDEGVYKDMAGVYANSRLLRGVDVFKFRKLSDLGGLNTLFSDDTKHFVYLPLYGLFQLVEQDNGVFSLSHEVVELSQDTPKLVGLATAELTESGIEIETVPKSFKSTFARVVSAFRTDFELAARILKNSAGELPVSQYERLKEN